MLLSELSELVSVDTGLDSYFSVPAFRSMKDIRLQIVLAACMKLRGVTN